MLNIYINLAIVFSPKVLCFNNFLLLTWCSGIFFKIFLASAHITCRSPDDYMNIANKIKRFFHNEGIHSTTIQPEFVVEDKRNSLCALECGQDDNCAAQKCCPGDNETEMRKRIAMTDGDGQLVNHITMV